MPGSRCRPHCSMLALGGRLFLRRCASLNVNNQSQCPLCRPTTQIWLFGHRRDRELYALGRATCHFYIRHARFNGHHGRGNIWGFVAADGFKRCSTMHAPIQLLEAFPRAQDYEVTERRLERPRPIPPPPRSRSSRKSAMSTKRSRTPPSAQRLQAPNGRFSTAFSRNLLVIRSLQNKILTNKT